MKNTQLYHLDLITTFPPKTDPNLVSTEFEAYYQSIINKLPNLPETKMSHLKIKLRSTCEKYNIIKIPYKDREVIIRLSKKPGHVKTKVVE